MRPSGSGKAERRGSQRGSEEANSFPRFHFATMALESGARRLGITPLAMYRRLKQQDLIHQRLLRHYDMLHTQSLDYVAEDIAETLKNWEEQQP